MSEMKLIMEGWRKYSDESGTGTVLLFEGSTSRQIEFDLLLERYEIDQVLKLWESSANYKCDELLREFKALDAAKQLFSNIGQKISDFILELSIQAFGLLQKGKQGITKVVSIISKILGTVTKYCNKLPLICKIAKTTAAVIALFAISALFFSPEAQAAIQMGKEPLDTDAYNYLRGFIADMMQDPDVAMDRKGEVLKIISQLDKLQQSPDVTQYESMAAHLQKALDIGANFHKYLGDAVEKGEMTGRDANKMVDYFTKLGESASGAYESIKYEGGSQERFSLSVADDLGPHPFRK